MKLCRMFAVVILLVGAVFAQTAKVKQLDSTDAAKAKQLYEQKVKIDGDIAAFNESVKEKYLRSKEGNCIGSGSLPLIWDCGHFEYSEDFRYIVPRVYEAPRNGNYSPWITGPLTINPSTFN